jgi:hypothetical protein
MNRSLFRKVRAWQTDTAPYLAACSFTANRTGLNAVASFLLVYTFNNIFRYKATTIPRLTMAMIDRDWGRMVSARFFHSRALAQ